MKPTHRPPRLLRRGRPAMATLFEVALVGDDPEHLGCVATAALDEAERIERLLSRHDPAAEIARVNRAAGQGGMLVDVEVMAVLLDLRRWVERTDGAFDPCLPDHRFRSVVRLDEARRTVALLEPDARLDLGGYGKGHAIDRMIDVARSFSVESGLIHGGTSSIRAIGRGAAGEAWAVDLRDPFAESDTDPPVDRIILAEAALSSSAVFHPGETRSDLIDPSTGRALATASACSVIAPDATTAEVLSTALLAMGRERARAFVRESGGLPTGTRIAWMERPEPDQPTEVTWWTPPPENRTS